MNPEKPLRIGKNTIKESYSIREVLLKEYGYTTSRLYKKFLKYIKNNDVDISHFNNLKNRPKRITPIEMYFLNKIQVKNHRLKELV